MKRKLCALCSLAALTLFTSCTQAPPAQTADTHDADVQALKDNEAQWNKDFQAKDADRLSAHYADDATLIAPGAPPWHGKDAIHSVLVQMVSDSSFTLSFSADRVEVSKSGDVAYTEGSYAMIMTDPATKKPVTDKGSYVTVYKKQADGSWKAVSDIASSATAPTAAKT